MSSFVTVHIYKRIQALLRNLSSRSSHIFRESNGAADWLARNMFFATEGILYDTFTLPGPLRGITQAPQVYFSGDTVMNLETELSRSSKIKCCSCGKKGAALGCYVTSCRKSYHVPCAYEILECRWDVEKFLVLCPTHTSYTLPCDKSKSKKPKNSSVESSVSSDCDASSMIKRGQAVWMSSSNLCKDWMICGSDLSMEEKVLLDKFARLSGLSATYSWRKNVTHVIAGTNEHGACIRSMKFLLAILNGRWVLNMGWIRACLEAQHLVPEEPYEITGDVHDCFDGPKTGRIRVMQKAPKLFKFLTFHFSGFVQPSYKFHLENLAIAGGGKVFSLSSPLSRESEKAFIVYCVEPLMDSNPMEIDKVVQERLENAEALAMKTGAAVVRHTLFLNAIAAHDLHMLSVML